MCIHNGMIKWIKITRQIKSTLNSRKFSLPNIMQVTCNTVTVFHASAVFYSSIPLQVIDLGVFLHPGSYCRNLWNILDATVVICALVAFFFEYVWIKVDEFLPEVQWYLCISTPIQDYRVFKYNAYIWEKKIMNWYVHLY